MMKLRIFLCLFFGTFFNEGISQQILVDSILQELEKENTPIQAADLHIGLVRAYNFVGDFSNQEVHLKKGETLAKEHNYYAGQIAALNARANLGFEQGKGPVYFRDQILQAKAIAEKHDLLGDGLFVDVYLAEYYITDVFDFEKAKEILEAAILKVSPEVSFKHVGNLYRMLGLLYSDIEEVGLAIENLKRSIEYFDQMGKSPHISEQLGRTSALEWDQGDMNKGMALIELASLHSRHGDGQEALGFIDQAIEVFEQNKAYIMLAWAREEKGIILDKIGIYDQSILNFQMAIKNFEEVEAILDLQNIHSNLGNSFLKLNETAAARKSYEKSLEYAEAIQDTTQMIHTNNNLGNLALLNQDPDLALSFFEKALRMSELIHFDYNLSNCYRNLGNAYVAKGEYQQANKSFQKALKILTDYPNSSSFLNNLLSLTNVYVKMDELDSAQFYANWVADSLAAYGSQENRLYYEQILSRMYEKMGDASTALAHQKAYVKILEEKYSTNAQQILKNEEVRQNVAAIEEDREKAELEAALLTSQNRLYLTVAIGLILILLLIGYLFSRLRISKKELESQNQQLHDLNLTKDKFFGIIAHDIRSPIVALEGVGEQLEYYLKKGQAHKMEKLAMRIDSTAKRLSGLLDNLLNWALLQQGVITAQPKVLPLKSMMEEVIAMFQANAEVKDIQVETNIKEDMQAYADQGALSTILRNLVSNAIKFTPIGGKVELSAEAKKEDMLIHVKDSGMGMGKEQMAKLFSLEKKSRKGTSGEKGTGLGLILVKELVELNKGKVQVASIPNEGTQFTLYLPRATMVRP